MVWSPAWEENGNKDHNFIAKLVEQNWQNAKYYSTYTADRPYPTGEPIIPTEEEKKLKMMALDCYQSQLNMSNKYYFDQMRWRPECITPTQ